MKTNWTHQLILQKWNSKIRGGICKNLPRVHGGTMVVYLVLCLWCVTQIPFPLLIVVSTFISIENNLHIKPTHLVMSRPTVSNVSAYQLVICLRKLRYAYLETRPFHQGWIPSLFASTDDSRTHTCHRNTHLEHGLTNWNGNKNKKRNVTSSF